MNAFMGADTDELRSLASGFAEGSQRLQDLRETADAFVRAVTWTGPDADEFKVRAVSVLADLSARASDVADRGRALDTEAEEQDSASSPEGSSPGVGADVGVSVGAGAGAWQPGGGVLPDFGKWFSDGSKKDDVMEHLDDAVRRIVDKKIDDAVEKLEWMNGGPRWLRRAKKFIPVIPDAIDFADHAVNGETHEAIHAIGRAGISLTAFGTVDDLSGYVFPFMPDDWKYPGTDVPLNEGSITEGMERGSLENPQPDSEMNKSIRDGERLGMDTSDRLGIENEHVRNTFKTFGGIAGGTHAAQRDPEDGGPWFIGKDPLFPRG